MCTILLPTILLILLAAPSVHAQLWQCPKPGGGSTYQDKQCVAQPQVTSPASVHQSAPTQEPLLEKGTLICLTATHFNQAVEAQSTHDERGYKYLLDKKICVITGRDLPVSMLYDNPRGPSQIRLYTEDGKTAQIVWTDKTFIHQ